MKGLLRLLRAQDFVSAVMDVDYSPTGREFVAGGYDRSVRIFVHNGGHSREVRPLLLVVAQAQKAHALGRMHAGSCR
jgi:hypothetical protein